MTLMEVGSLSMVWDPTHIILLLKSIDQSISNFFLNNILKQLEETTNFVDIL